MTITGLYTQNLTLSFNSSSSSLLTPVIVGQEPGADAPRATATTADATVPATDTVTISPEAIIRQTVAVTLALAPASTAPADAAATTPSAPEPAPGDALFAALDADGDGTVTKDEFVEGAQNLLQHAGRHGRGHGHYHGRGIEDGERGHGHDGSRLTGRLERLFNLVDANGDGGVKKTELAEALQRTEPDHAAARTSAPSQDTQVVTDRPWTSASPRSRTNPSQATATVAHPEAAATVTATNNNQGQAIASSDAPPPVGSFVTITQITITVAIQQYTTVSASGSTAPSSTLRAAA